MTTSDRSGFTIVELIVVSVLGAFVLGAVFQVLLTNQRTYTTQAAVIEGQQGARMALELLFHDLREVSPAGGDIVSMSATKLEVRLMRKFGVVCETDLFNTPPTLKVLNDMGGERFEGNPTTPDSVWVFADNDDGTPNDDTWIRAAVTQVDTMQTCLSGRPASQLTFASQGAKFLADTVHVGAAVRSFEIFRFGARPMVGNWYLSRGQLTSSDTTAYPVAGPIQWPGGLQFIYRDAMGDVTTVPGDVRQIEVHVRTRPGVLNPIGNQVADSITAWIHTRN